MGGLAITDERASQESTRGAGELREPSARQEARSLVTELAAALNVRFSDTASPRHFWRVNHSPPTPWDLLKNPLLTSQTLEILGTFWGTSTQRLRRRRDTNGCIEAYAVCDGILAVATCSRNHRAFNRPSIGRFFQISPIF